MKCIYCNGKTKVTNSRSHKLGHSTWRRRECVKCRAIITSEEEYKLSDCLQVLKKNGDSQPFNRDKLFLSILKSVDHLPQKIETASYLTETILRHSIKDKPLSPCLRSDYIAKSAISVLKNFDAAAAIKYNSFQTNMKLANDVRRSIKK